ncbi:MAG: type IV toxin-antitoxin system AbiEi family antitoxin domain-containing protein [Chloroflexi bacterium]|nr:type IV toxin-antitoxin system AbiEi family antitoxin domain-containing protein [Chloroflexota bacterium]
MPDKFTPFKTIFEKHEGILRAAEAIRLGVPEHVIYEMVEKGELLREARGIYRLADSEMPSDPDLVQVSLLVPKAVICLISALYFYELTTQIPHSIYVALPQNTPRPRVQYPPLEVFWVKTSLHSVGVDVHVLDGVKVKIYNREKTVADCFKFRNRVGEDVALEALKDYIRQPNLDVHTLLEYARIDRVDKLMMPYLKSLL